MLPCGRCPRRGGPEPRSARVQGKHCAKHSCARHGGQHCAHSLLPAACRLPRRSCVSHRGRNALTLHRSHACPVRFESASLRLTLPEKSWLLAFSRWCGLTLAWCACWCACWYCEPPWPPCSMRWILLVLARLASSSDMRFAMMDASAVSSELRLTREQPDADWPESAASIHVPHGRRLPLMLSRTATLTGNKKRLLWLCTLPQARTEVAGERDADQFP